MEIPPRHSLEASGRVFSQNLLLSQGRRAGCVGGAPMLGAEITSDKQTNKPFQFFLLSGRFYSIPTVLSGVSFFLGFPLLFFSSLAFSSLPPVFLCERGCLRRCRKYPLSLVGFSGLAFCSDPLISSGGTARDRNV